VTQVVANFPAICENQRFITVFSRSQLSYTCTFCLKDVVSIVLPSVFISSNWVLPPDFQFITIWCLRRSTRVSNCAIKQWGLKTVTSAGSGEDHVSGLGKAGNFLDSVTCVTAEYQLFRRCECA
jgi:hypothetical protein